MSDENYIEQLMQAPLEERRAALNAIPDLGERMVARATLAWKERRLETADLKTERPEFLKAMGNPRVIDLNLAALRGVCIGELRRLNELVDTLTERIAELESRPALKYCGVFDAKDTPYRPGEFVTHKGSLWHCWDPTSEVPGRSGAWQLAVKRGKDAHG